ncbi:hypothetical protein DFH08DRAFT_1025750 [Mycena albidolilacea]|uniref:Uncharacterized protein n=1 Tax=Mycena albidolilacea TaxID=1033008 RepID=A0AAD7AMY2_9AGAR|nr:hypothetical protein DFH08DRAFT_1025750 [Mycena albidolilacea]
MSLSSSAPGEDGPPVRVTGERRLAYEADMVEDGRKEAIAVTSREDEGSNRGEVEGKLLPLTREYEAEQMSTMKDESEHRGHGKRKVRLQWREMKTKGRERRRETKMKYKNKNQSLTFKHIRHVIHALPPHTLTVLRRPPAAKALEVERELVNRQQRNWSRFCERRKNERSTSAHAHRKRTGNGEENADQARVPVACGKRRSGKTRARASIGAAAPGRRRRRGARTLKRGR